MDSKIILISILLFLVLSTQPISAGDEISNQTLAMDEDVGMSSEAGEDIVCIPDIEDNMSCEDDPVTDAPLSSEDGEMIVMENTEDAVYRSPARTSLDVKVDDIYVGDDALIDIYISPDIAAGSATIDIDGVKITTEFVDGIIHRAVSNLKSGRKSITVTYGGDEDYLPCEGTEAFNVMKRSSDLDIDTEDIFVGEDEIVTITLPYDAMGQVEITVDGVKYTKAVIGGKAFFNIGNFKAGTHMVDVVYDGDEKYLPTTGSDVFKVFSFTPLIRVSSPDIRLGEDGIITVTGPDDATGKLILSVDGKRYTALIEGEKATFVVSNLTVGSHDITVLYSGDDEYYSATALGEIEVLPANDTLNETVNNPKVGFEKYPTANPILALVLALLAVGLVNVRRF